METDSYNEAFMVWLSWSGEISLMCRRQCLVNQAVNPYARGILIWRWNVSSDLKIQFLINRVWWLFYVQFRFWRFSFWLIEKSIRGKSRGHAWLLHIQNVNLPVDVEVEMSLSDWSGNLGPTRGVISLAREVPNLEQLEQNLISKLAAFEAESDITIAT